MSEEFLGDPFRLEPDETTIEFVQRPGDYPFRVPDIYSVRRVSTRVGVDGNLWSTLYCVRNPKRDNAVRVLVAEVGRLTADNEAAFERGKALGDVRLKHLTAKLEEVQARRDTLSRICKSLEDELKAATQSSRPGLADVDRRLALVEMALKEVCEDLPNLSARLVELAEKKLDAGVMVAVADDIAELMTKVVALRRARGEE